MKTSFTIYFTDGYIQYNLINRTFRYTGKVAHIFLGMRIKHNLSDNLLLRIVFGLNKRKNLITNTILEVK